MKPAFALLSILLFSCLGQAQDRASAHPYTALNEVSAPRALLVLFDGGAGIAARIPAETAIPDTAAQRNVLAIGIDQSEFYLNDSTYQRISATIKQVMEAHNISGGLYMGGFSLGGYTTIRFSEMAVEKEDPAVIPNAIFAVDPPLDHLSFREYCLRELARDCPLEEANTLGKGEAQWVLNYYDEHFGTIENDSSDYVANSCFTEARSDGGNARFLLDVPVRLYHELDPMWLIKERCRTLEDVNAFTGSEFINHLYHHGNTRAELILSQDKGYRSDGRRHPHSWSIADPVETMEWLMRYTNK